MKNKYKINIDQPLPSEDKISQHKDFGRILADYHNLTQPIYRRPLYKNPKAFIGLVFILSIAFLVFWAVEQEEKEKAKTEEAAKMPQELLLAEENAFLKAPIPALALPVMSVKANASKPQAIEVPGKVTVQVPADAFQTANGNPATGDIDLAIRAVSQPAELIAMGLPMQADNQLIQQHLVLELNASQNGQPLTLRSGKSIHIEQEVAPEYSQALTHYNLDPKSRKWAGTSDAPIQPIVRKQNAASIGQEDGFGVIQFDENGKVIPEKRKPAIDGKEIKVLSFDLQQLGIACLGESASKTSGLMSYKVRFTDPQGQSLRILTLYSLPEGLNTVQFFWPKSADFTFEPSILSGTSTTFAGFLPDGRLAISQPIGLLPNTVAVHTLQMEISDSPVKDIHDLTQRLAPASGH